MQICAHIRNLLFVLVLLISSYGYSQLSKKHYIPPLTSSAFGNANPEDQYIYISTPTTSLVPYTITPVGGTPITGTVSNATPQIESVGFGLTQLFVSSTTTSIVTNNKGYIIEAEAPIYVSVRMNAGGAQAGALVSKGLSALDTAFRIGTYTSANPQSNYLSFVSVMATEDNTVVTFDDLPAGLIIENYSGTTPITITLDEGDSYILAANTEANGPAVNGLMDGLIGCLVTSNKPIVTNCGSANGSFGGGNARDYGIDQIAGLSKVGKEYIFVRGNGDDDWENVLVVAHTNNTTISINGNAPIATINAGEYHVIEGSFYSDGNMYVETSEDVFVYQGVGGFGNNGQPSEANQGMFFVPPLSCETRGNIDNIANIDFIGNLFYSGGVSIVTRTGASVTINNAALNSIPGATVFGPINVDGNNDYVTYKITGLAGNISVQGDDELYVAYFNQNGSATSGSFYSGFPTNPEINFDAQFATLGNCIPNITLEAANAQNFDTFEWFYDDGSGFQPVPASLNAPSITPTIPARYKLIGIIACTGGALESVEIPVSICPDDIDNDGIIDNLDIDNDNDGILNCTESRGDVTLNISDENNPVLVFQDNTTNNTIATATYVDTSSSGNTNGLTGDNSGNFTSIVSNALSAEGDYTINFTEPVNVKLTEHTTIINTATVGDKFVVRITPTNKNITLVDPDDRLLVDTNFDGLFETGITQISGSEIHFRVNQTPNGNTPFEFLANSVDGFSFIHRLENLTDSSTFTANISLTCFKNDNDNDGVKDELDLDSDNDGIPDFVENQGTLVALSGIDSDTNGLDNVYDINALPLDSDNDGVYDFYDLDSDNDGIYDLIESGQLGTLSDTNLDGIEDGPTYGVNGWADAAETTPDSNLIGYTPNDLDTDTIFSYLDLDSDGDTCSDVIEAGFSDGNVDDLLGDNPVITDTNGLVTNATDGYTLPNSDYLDFAPIIITTQPANTDSCELSTTVISLDSSTYDTIQWEVSTDGGFNWNIIIDDATYSGSQTVDLTISNTPLSFNTYQYRAFLELAGNSCGFYSDPAELTVILLPVANTAPDMLLCDDDNNGTMPFDLRLQDDAINTNTGFTITYHETLPDAENGIITIPDFTNFESGNTTIWVRVENNANTTCYDISSFDLEVYESPFPLLMVTPLQECDDTSVGTDIDGLKVFDLTQKETEILNGQSATDFTLTYFTDASYTTPIVTPISFPNTVPNTQTIYVRVTNNAYNTCVAETSFNVDVMPLPVISSTVELVQCDDDDQSTLGFSPFNLTEAENEISSNAANENFIYFTSNTAAVIGDITSPDYISNPIAYINDTVSTDTVWARVETQFGCERIAEVQLRVSTTAIPASFMRTFYQCDDFLDEDGNDNANNDDRDGIATFNFSSVTAEILALIPPGQNPLPPRYFRNEADALAEINEIDDPSNYRNIGYPGTQQIYIRVDSAIANDCLGLGWHITLNVEALPFANPVSFLPQCDYDTTDTVTTYPFDTSQLESDILNGQSLADVNVTYFDSNGNPLLDILGNPITSSFPATFLTATQTITAIVTNNNTLAPDGPCPDEMTIEFIVHEQPIANPVTIPEACDDGTDTTDINDGLHTFDLSAVKDNVLNGQNDVVLNNEFMNIFFTYIDEDGATVSMATNLPDELVSGDQTILVEVENSENSNCSAQTEIILKVNPLPEFDITETPQIVCSSDPTFEVDLEVFPDNPSDITTYEWRRNRLDGSAMDEFVSNDQTITVNVAGTYFATLTNISSIGGCSRTKEVFVNNSELATVTLDDVTVVDFTENNNTVTIDPTNLGQGDYEYALVEEDSNFIIYQDEPEFTNVKPGFYTIYVNDKNGCGVTTLNISVLGYMKFFTPNNDSYNDYWQIIGVSETFQTNSRILIFDRYGKLIKQISTLQDGWDGTFNGNIMPTDDYWFKVFLEDGRFFSGHFTLKR